MNGVTAEIAIEIRVLLQHHHGYPGPREQIAGHHTCRAAADNYAANFHFVRRTHCKAALISTDSGT